MPSAARIAIENVNTPGRVTNVHADKYRAMRDAMLQVLPKGLPGMTQAELRQAVLPHLPPALFPNGETSMWWAKTVQLDLEAKDRVRRDATARPLRWYLP